MKNEKEEKELKGLCKKCLGCNRLELDDFEGVEECKNAVLVEQ